MQAKATALEASERPSPALAIAIAAISSAAVLWSGAERSLPALVGSAAFLFFVVEEDVRRGRIPNALTLPALFCAVGLAYWTGGWSGIATSLFGAGVAFALLFPFFLLRVLGAGDVKALMVLGAVWGAASLLGSLWWMVVAGGIVALAVGVARGSLADVLRRWKLALLVSLTMRRPTYFPPAAGSAAQIPFGVAIALGAAAHQLWGLPWA